jgi:heme exporter protein C
MAARLLLALLVGVVTLWTFIVPDAIAFQEPALARIVFFHLPPAFLATAFLIAGSYFSVRYLMQRVRHWDERAVSANEMGFLLAIVTMATGILFSRVQWGAWWQWDPRQTSFLMVLLLYAAYFALRAAFGDESKRAASAAAYGAAMLLPVVFLIFVYPRLEHVREISFHPSMTVKHTIEGTGQGFDQNYWTVVLAVFIVMLVVSVWAYRMRVRAGLLEQALEDEVGNLEAVGGHPAPTGVVRPIRLHGQSGEEA